MKRRLANLLQLSLLSLLPAAAMAQIQKPELPYNTALVVSQQEAGVENPSFVPSAKVRGMKALADGKVYLVSTDNRSLSAYQGERLVWKSDVVGACSAIVGQRAIRKVTISSQIIYVLVGNQTFAEVNMRTGKIHVAEVQKI